MRRWVSGAAAPVLFGLAFLGLWELIVQIGRIAPYVLPAPTAIAGELADNADIVWLTGLASGANALIGLLLGGSAGLLAALVASRLRLVGEVSLPLAAAANALPIVAVAPLLSNMFSTTSDVPRRFVVAIVVFFPLFINATRGLREIAPVHRDLMASYHASGWTTARLVRLPGALPFVFTGLRQAAPLAVIAAVIAEYFGGLQNGLGSRIISYAGATAYARAWAFVVGACALGLLFYLSTLLLERLATPWRHRRPT